MRLSTRPHDWREFGAKKAHWLGKVIRSQRWAFAVSGTGYFSRPRLVSQILDPGTIAGAAVVERSKKS
jgi:hypothetical protein